MTDRETRPAGTRSIEALTEDFRTRDYIADRSLTTAVFLALELGRPLLLEGEAGVGKTELAKVLAASLHLDPAFRRPGRFDRVIFVPPPDAPARSAILTIQLRGKPAADVDVDQVASRLDMFSGADIKGLVDQAVEVKLGEAMRTGIPTPLRTKDLLDVARKMVPTTREWFATARNHVLYANQAGLYDAVRPWLKL